MTVRAPRDDAVRDASARGGTDGAAFDALAADYDELFTGSVLGRRYREAVWAHLDEAFGPGDRVLDLGCGTGEDAVRLAERGVRVVAVDASSEMVRATRAKAAENGVGSRVEVRCLPMEELADLEAADGGPGEDAGTSAKGGPFDGVLSNFGALNCVAELEPVSEALAPRTRPGALVFLCLMGRLVPWEWAWFLARGRPRKAFRRLRPDGVEWRGVRVRYPSPGAVAKAFAPAFRSVGVTAVGALLPPSYAEAWAKEHPGAVRVLDGMERRLEAVPPFPWLADHYLLRLERR